MIIQYDIGLVKSEIQKSVFYLRRSLLKPGMGRWQSFVPYISRSFRCGDNPEDLFELLLLGDGEGAENFFVKAVNCFEHRPFELL